jgi:hypothetical protein
MPCSRICCRCRWEGLGRLSIATASSSALRSLLPLKSMAMAGSSGLPVFCACFAAQASPVPSLCLFWNQICLTFYRASQPLARRTGRAF